MNKIDIVSIYRYYNKDKEKISILDKEFKKNENIYVSSDLILKFFDKEIEVINQKMNYNKVYNQNKLTLSKFNLGNEMIITKIKTKKIEKINKTYKIIASEYTENGELIYDVIISIKIKEN